MDPGGILNALPVFLPHQRVQGSLRHAVTQLAPAFAAWLAALEEFDDAAA
jgi:hypothetical protein